MPELEEALQNWDGTSAPPDEVKQHIMSLTDSQSPHDKVNEYIKAFDGSDSNDIRHELFRPGQPVVS